MPGSTGKKPENGLLSQFLRGKNAIFSLRAEKGGFRLTELAKKGVFGVTLPRAQRQWTPQKPRFLPPRAVFYQFLPYKPGLGPFLRGNEPKSDFKVGKLTIFWPCEGN